MGHTHANFLLFHVVLGGKLVQQNSSKIGTTTRIHRPPPPLSFGFAPDRANPGSATEINPSFSTETINIETIPFGFVPMYYHYLTHPVADPWGALLPTHQNFFNFIRFFRKCTKLCCCHLLLGWRLLLRQMRDPSLKPQGKGFQRVRK